MSANVGFSLLIKTVYTSRTCTCTTSSMSKPHVSSSFVISRINTGTYTCTTMNTSRSFTNEFIRHSCEIRQEGKKPVKFEKNILQGCYRDYGILPILLPPFKHFLVVTIFIKQHTVSTHTDSILLCSFTAQWYLRCRKCHRASSYEECNNYVECVEGEVRLI